MTTSGKTHLARVVAAQDEGTKVGEMPARAPDERFLVSRSSQIPLYHQVANDIRERIASGAWAPGRQIPTEPELTNLYGASRITIRQALANLAQEGLISRQRGRGSFVRDARIIARPSRLSSFTADMRAKGVVTSSRVLVFEVADADDAVASRLGLPRATPTLRLERLRFGDGEPIGIQTSILPAGPFVGLLEVDFSTTSLYEELERRYGVVIDDAHETFIATILEGDAAVLLGVPHPAPGFIVERVGLSRGHPVEYTRSLMRGDRYQIQIRLHRSSRVPLTQGDDAERVSVQV